MGIVWDSTLVAAMARELSERLAGERVRAVQVDRSRRVVTLFMDPATLVFRLHPTLGQLVEASPRDPPGDARSLPVTLDAVRADPDERVLVLELRRVRGRQERSMLVVELMTNQWNALLVDVASRRIEWCLHPRDAGDRTLAGGAEYSFPEPSQRRGRRDLLSRSEWMELLAGAEPGERRSLLLRGVAWTSALNVDALLGAAAGADEARAREALDGGYRLWLRLRMQGDHAPEPVVLELEHGPQPYPIPLPDTEGRGVRSLREAMALAAEAGDDDATPPSRLMERAEERLGRLRGKIRGLERELEEAPEPGRLRGLGDLILARFQEIPRGETRAVLPDFDGEQVEVKLDPTLEPQGNASRYYDEAARAERARKRLPVMIQEAEDKARLLQEAVDAVLAEEAEPESLAELLPEAPEGDDGGGGEEEGLPYRRYRSSGGLEIRVGRGARSNDDLTFRHSSPDDIWLHARQAPGSHVILRWQSDDNPPARDLAEAAVLAALASKARTSGSVPVSWTRRKNVRKPRKAPPGKVIPDRVKTVFVKPDPKVAERLAED